METDIWHWYFGENMETHSSLYWSFSKTSLRIRFYGYAKVSEKNFLRICFYGFAKYLGFHTNLEMFSYNFSEKVFLCPLGYSWIGLVALCLVILFEFWLLRYLLKIFYHYIFWQIRLKFYWTEMIHLIDFMLWCSFDYCGFDVRILLKELS